MVPITSFVVTFSCFRLFLRSEYVNWILHSENEIVVCLQYFHPLKVEFESVPFDKRPRLYSYM